MKKILEKLKSLFKTSSKDKCFKCSKVVDGPAIYKKAEVKSEKFEYRWFHASCERPAPINLYQGDQIENKGFMRDDKRWEADIKARKELPDGKIARFKPDGTRYA